MALRTKRQRRPTSSPACSPVISKSGNTTSSNKVWVPSFTSRLASWINSGLLLWQAAHPAPCWCWCAEWGCLSMQLPRTWLAVHLLLRHRPLTPLLLWMRLPCSVTWHLPHPHRHLPHPQAPVTPPGLPRQAGARGRASGGAEGAAWPPLGEKGHSSPLTEAARPPLSPPVPRPWQQLQHRHQRQSQRTILIW